MRKQNFRELLAAKWAAHKFVCVGLDSDYESVPLFLRDLDRAGEVSKTIFEFNRMIVESTRDIAGAYKPNFAFYARHGADGLAVLQRTITEIHLMAPDVPVIVDGKFGDIGNTNIGYVILAFAYLGADAVTVNPYLGEEALKPFFDCVDKGIFVLCKTSNPGSGEFQDIVIRNGPILVDDDPMYSPLHQHVARRIAGHWNKNQNCGLVVGGTYPEDLAPVRKIVGDGFPILIPGVGAQGGDLEKTVRAGMDSRGEGMLINSSRGIIFASRKTDFAEAARGEALKLHSLINQYR